MPHEIALLRARFDHMPRVPRVDVVGESPVDARNSRLPKHCLLCAALVMHQRLFCGPQHQLVAYDNVFTVKRRCGFDWKQWS